MQANKDGKMNTFFGLSIAQGKKWENRCPISHIVVGDNSR